MKTVKTIIIQLGGNKKVAEMCAISLPAVSGWIKKNHIPHAWYLWLKATHHDVFLGYFQEPKPWLKKSQQR